jgi:hypothetical protein
MENEIQQNNPPVQPLPQTSTSAPTPPPTNWSNVLLFTILGLIVVAGSVFAGIQIGKTQTPIQQPVAAQPTILPTQAIASPTVIPTQIITPTALLTATPAIDPTANWKTYTNTKYNYSFKIPTNWTNYSMNDFSSQQFTNTEELLYLGPKNTDIKPPQVMQISTYKISAYTEQEVYPPANCTVTSLKVGLDQTQATRKICKGMESNGYTTVKTSQYVFIIDELKDSEANHELFTRIISTFKFTN